MTETTAPACRHHGPMTLRNDDRPIEHQPGPTWFCADVVCFNRELRPAEGVAPLGTIEINHTRADGTLLTGSRRGDGVWELVRPHRFTWGRSLPGVLFIRQSRDRRADHISIRRASEALRAAGWTVTVDIDEDTRRSFADAEAEREQRSEDRAERYTEYAGNAAARSEAGYKRAREIAHGIPLGQPVLTGHHSERRARADIARMDRGMRTSIDEDRKAKHYAQKAEASGAYAKFRKSPGVTLRRIAKLEADLRRVEKWARGESAGGFTRELTPDTVAELDRRREELTEELAYWAHVIKQAEADGFKVWSRADFQKGDFVLYGGTWYEVLRVNAKSVTIPHIHNGTGRKVVRKGDGHVADWTWLAPYDGVKGRKTAEEMDAAQSPAEPAAEPVTADQAPVTNEDRHLPLDR